jgi:hypothetical protein
MGLPYPAETAGDQQQSLLLQGPQLRAQRLAAPGGGGAHQLVELGAAGDREGLGTIAAEGDEQAAGGVAEDRGAIGERAVRLVGVVDVRIVLWI